MTCTAALLYQTTGRPVESERWADILDRWQYQDPGWPGDPASQAWAALVRCLHCRGGVEQLRADAEECARNFALIGSPDPSDLYLGLACVLSGDPQSGDPFFQAAISKGELINAQELIVDALCERSLVAMARGDWSAAETFADQARSEARLPGELEQAMVWMVHARIAMHRGDVPAARQALANAQLARHLLTFALPHVSVQTLIGLARVHLALADIAAARTLMKEIDEILQRRPHLGALAGEAAELRARLAQQRGFSAPGASALTAAELRLLPLLSTHLSFPEIGAQLFLSRTTIKSQAQSIYRKLGVSSRSPAVARARELGLLEG